MNTNIHQLTADLVTQLSGTHQGPCLSLYQPTHRHHPGNLQDPIRFRGLLKQIRQTLHEHHTTDTINTLTEPLESMGRDRDFWNHTLDGLAVFAAPGLFRVIRLPRPVQELVVAADSFHTKPLRRFLQSADRYQVLELSLSAIKLYEGTRDALDPVDLAPQVPRTITEALGEELTEPHQTVAAYGGTGGESRSMHHGHGGRKDELDSDQERFFRAIDRAILDHHSRPSGLPLLLAALSEHQGEFRQISKNPFLLADGIKINPGALSMDQLREQAWEQFEPQYQARLAKLVEDFAVATSRGLGLEQLAPIAEAAVLGRIATLLVEADREIGGRLDAETGRIERGDLNHPELDDLLDDLGDLVLKKGGRVLVIPAERMPTTTGAAAICRYS
jgi:hypothetical protein